MRKQEILKGAERDHLLQILHDKYSVSSTPFDRWTYWRKKYSWLFVVKGAKVIKRTLDIIVSAILLVVLAPVMAVIALILKLSDGGAIFYVSDRVGKWGTVFRFPKFRSMVRGADELREELLLFNRFKEETRFKMIDDPRITPFGRFLRKTSLDELPQLWCVLKGEMSLVGPRPPLVEEVELYTIEERGRLDIIPGLTCIWQVSGRSEIPFSGQVNLDIQYIESQSIWGDIKLLVKTIPAVFFGRGAY